MEEEDVAAAMGFSSFGTTKKRKFDQTNAPKAKVDTTGANSTRLGVRPKVVEIDEVQEPQVTDNALINDPAEDAAGSQPQPPASKRWGTQKQPVATGLAGFLARGQALSEKPQSQHLDAQLETSHPIQDDSSVVEMVSFGGPSISRAELNALRFGVRDENGDTAYFLPSFVEDPWGNFMRVRR